MEVHSYIDVVHESLLGSGSALGLVVQSKANGYLVMEDEGPDQTQDELQVALDNVPTSYRHRLHHNTRPHPLLVPCLLTAPPTPATNCCDVQH